MILTNSVLLADAGVWYAFANSDTMGKGIVFLLFLSSMVAWFIMIEKGLALYRAQKLSERFAKSFNEQHGMNSMLRDGMENPCPVAKVYISGMEQLLEFYGLTAEELRDPGTVQNKNNHRKLSPAQLDAVQTAMEREISGQIFVIEERIGMLATAVSLAPFLGLFGTVWGVMIAFCGVASAGSANIQALAPGVAGALLTTVAGLVVAIPSLVGYNFLTQMIRKITVSMDNFSEAFMAQLKLEQLTAREETPAANTRTMPQEQQPMLRQQPIRQQVQASYVRQPELNTGYSQQLQSGGQMQYNNSTVNNQFVQQPRQAQYQQSAPVPPMPDAPAEQMSFGGFADNNNDPDNSMRV